jgi:hypothetical protein
MSMATDDNFDAFVDGLQTQHEQKKRNEAEDRAVRRVERVKEVAEGVKWLRDSVLPLLDKAREALQRKQMHLEVNNNFEVEFYASKPPSISFRCQSQPRPSDGYRMSGRAFEIHCDGKVFHFARGSHEFSTRADVPDGQGIAVTAAHLSDLISNTISECIKEFYKVTLPKVHW